MSNSNNWASQTRQTIHNNNYLDILLHLTNTLEQFINAYSDNNNVMHRINNLNHIIDLISNEINYYQYNNQNIN